MPSLDTARSNGMEEADRDALMWHGELVDVYSGDISTLATRIPLFERKPFGVSDGYETPGYPGGPRLRPWGENKLCDVVVRMPLFDGDLPTPVGIVSKRYTLVQHQDLFQKATEALKKAGIETGERDAELLLSAYGSRMEATFTFPKKFAFDPGDGSPITLRLYCVNSVDASSRLAIMLGWFRFICGNGLILGTTLFSQRLVHNEFLQLPDLDKVLTQGISLAEKEKEHLRDWIKKTVPQNKLEAWVDGKLCKMWGPLAAARIWHICRTGKDGEFANPAEKAPPHIKEMVPTVAVPGAPRKAENAYHICQALSWVVRERRQVQDQLDGMRQLPELMKALVSSVDARLS